MPVFTRSALFGVVLPALAALVPLHAAASDKGNPEAKRIVAVGGTITEILYALGAGERVIARDSTSTYPAEVVQKPDVGYMRALSSEGVLAQKPDLILSEDGAGPPDVIGILKASEVPMVTIDTPPDAKAIAKKIEDVGAAVGLDGKAKALADNVDAELASLSKDVAAVGTRKSGCSSFFRWPVVASWRRARIPKLRRSSSLRVASMPRLRSPATSR